MRLKAYEHLVDWDSHKVMREAMLMLSESTRIPCSSQDDPGMSDAIVEKGRESCLASTRHFLQDVWSTPTAPSIHRSRQAAGCAVDLNFESPPGAKPTA